MQHGSSVSYPSSMALSWYRAFFCPVFAERRGVLLADIEVADRRWLLLADVYFADRYVFFLLLTLQGWWQPCVRQHTVPRNTHLKQRRNRCSLHVLLWVQQIIVDFCMSFFRFCKSLSIFACPSLSSANHCRFLYVDLWVLHVYLHAVQDRSGVVSICPIFYILIPLNWCVGWNLKLPVLKYVSPIFGNVIGNHSHGLVLTATPRYRASENPMWINVKVPCPCVVLHFLWMQSSSATTILQHIFNIHIWNLVWTLLYSSIVIVYFCCTLCTGCARSAAIWCSH